MHGVYIDMKSVLAKPTGDVEKRAALPKVAHKKSDATRQRVLESATELFRRSGYQATSMRDIAAAVGMKSGSLYYYHKSKEALLAAILSNKIDVHLSTMRQAVEGLPDGSTVREKFATAIRISANLVAEAGDMALASTQTLSYLQEPEYSEQVEHRRAYNQFWRDLIDEGKKTGEIREDIPVGVASMAMVGALAFVGEWYQKRRNTDEIAEIFLSLFFDGLHS